MKCGAHCTLIQAWIYLHTYVDFHRFNFDSILNWRSWNQKMNEIFTGKPFWDRFQKGKVNKNFAAHIFFHLFSSLLSMYVLLSREVTVYPKSINNNDGTENSMFAFDMFLWVNNNRALYALHTRLLSTIFSHRLQTICMQVCTNVSACVRACVSERDFLRKSFDFNIFVNDVIRENMAKRAHETNVQ